MEPQTPTERMIQEYVPGKQVTLAHLIANPGKDLFKKLGLPDAVSAIGILTITPSEHRLSPATSLPSPARWRSVFSIASPARWG